MLPHLLKFSFYSLMYNAGMKVFLSATQFLLQPSIYNFNSEIVFCLH